MHIQPIELRSPHSHEIARGIQAVQMAAYAQEALLLGFTDVQDFPPMQRDIDSLLESNERFIVAFDGGAIVGAIGVEPAASGEGHVLPRWAGEALPAGEAHIASLTVLPSHQRLGIARALLSAAIAAHAGGPVTVSTSERNHPALMLYAQSGFVRVRGKRITWDCHRTGMTHVLDLVLLRRNPSHVNAS